jgi:hypothetical protein
MNLLEENRKTPQDWPGQSFFGYVPKSTGNKTKTDKWNYIILY